MRKMKKREGKGIALLASAIMVITAMAAITAIPAVAATDWQQFQEDELNTGIANDKILGRSVSWSAYTHTDPWNMAGIDVVSIVAEGNVYVLDVLGYIWSFNAVTGAENGNKSYNSATNPPYFQTSTPAYGAGRVYFAMSSGTKKGHVFAVNANDVTSHIWEAIINESEQINTPITYDNGKVYFGTWNGTMCDTYSGKYYCRYATNGNLVWSYPPTAVPNNGYYWAGACIIGNYIVFGDDLGNITCVNKSTGAFIDDENIRTVDTNAVSIRSSVTCNATYHNATCGRCYFTDGTVCGTSLSGRLWAYDFNTTTGDLTYAWKRTLSTQSKSTPVVHNGRVYVCDGSFQVNGRLYSIYESNGTVKWSYQVPDNGGTGNPGITASPAISVDGDDLYIYFTTDCENGRLWCVNESGNLCWYYEPTESTSSGEYILQGVSLYQDASGKARVFFGNDRGNLYALDKGMCGEVTGDDMLRMSDVNLLNDVVGHVPGTTLDHSQWAGDVNCDKNYRMSDVNLLNDVVGHVPGTTLDCCCND